MAFLTFYNSINEWLFIQTKCPYSIDAHNHIVQISNIRTIIGVMSILLFEIIVIFFGNGDSHMFDAYCNSEICAQSGYLVTILMIHSQIILAMLMRLIREEQRQLLQKIGEFDKCVTSALGSAMNVDQLKRRFLFLLSIFGINNALLFFSHRMLETEIKVNVLIFGIAYIVADLCFTAVIWNMCCYGYFFNHRYGALIDRLKFIVRDMRHINRKHFSEVSNVYSRLFDLQLNFSKIFGQILAFTFLFHWIVITIAIYMSIYTIRIDPKRLNSVVLQVIITLMPYTIRIGVIVKIFVPIGQQVLASPPRNPYTSMKFHKRLFCFQISGIRKVVGKINVPCDQPMAYCVRIVVGNIE